MSNLMRAIGVGLSVGVVCVAAAQPLPTDPAVVSGTLENGLTYCVRRHATPPGRATVWMHMHTGSLNESESQRGLAHYLEHMAFNGSEHFPPGSVVPFFQSLGMTFGRDQNAYTNMGETTYQLSLPDAEPETLDKGMMFFSDICSGLLLTPAEIDAERQIIQEERRRGLSGRQRTGFYILEHIAPGSIYGERITIGKEETINAVKQPDFRDYYGKWYGAGNATVLVVADRDPAEVVKIIKSRFGDAPKRPRPTPQDAGVKAYAKSFAIVASDDEVASERLEVTRLEPGRPATTTVPQYRADLVSRLAGMAMDRRFDTKIARGGTSYLNAGVGASNTPGVIYEASISMTPAPGKWREALNEVAAEVQRARSFGFTPHEIDEVRKQVLSGAERAVETERTAPASALIRRMNSAIADAEPIMSARQNLDLLRELLPGITQEEIGARFAKEFDTKAVAFVATMPTASAMKEGELLEAGTKAFAVTPTRETEAVEQKPLMTESPAGGKVTEGAEHAATGVWSGWLSNNVRVLYKFNDTRENEVSIHIALLGGEMLETGANRGITRAAEVAWMRPATQHLTSSEVRDLMTGKKVSVRGGGFGGGGRRGGGGGASPSAMSLTISGSPEDLETGFQLAYLLLTEPKIESASFTQMQTMAGNALKESMKNPLAFGVRTAASVIYPENEARLRPSTSGQIEALKIDAAQAWLDRMIKESPVEVTIVGDIPRDRVLALTAKYLGSLATRERVSPASFGVLRKVERPKPPHVVEKTLETPTPQAFVMSGFYGADETNVADARALTMAARILSTRMVKEVREESQLVYSIGASSRAATTYPGFGVFSAAAPTEPGKAGALVAKLASMYAAFAKDGPTEEEMDVAKKQMANTFKEQLEEPGYWAGQLRELTFRGESLDDIAAEPRAFQQMTSQQVKEAFARYYTKDNTIVVSVLPASSGAGHADEKPGPREKAPAGS